MREHDPGMGRGAGHRQGARPMIRTVIASVVAVASIGVYVVALLASGDAEAGPIVIYAAATASTVLVGVLHVASAPAHGIGPLLLISGAFLSISVVLKGYAQSGATATPPLPGIGIVDFVASQLLYISIVIVLVAIPLVFPDGRLLSTRWRWLVALLVAVLAAAAL